MRAKLEAIAAGLMAANRGWVVLPDDQCTMLFALPGHLRGAFWLGDVDPNRLARRMTEVESLLGRTTTSAPAGRRSRPRHHHRKRRISHRGSSKPVRPVATPRHAIV